MKKFVLLALACLTFTIANAQVSIGVTPYATLQAAFAAINAGTHTGAITVKISGSTVETGTAVLNATGSGAANYTSVTIFPIASGLQISGSLNAPLIDLNGATNVTLDGRVSATGSVRDLKILNNNTGALASTIRFIESAQMNTVNYCIIKGASQNATGGILFFSTSTAGTGNSSNTISNNDITGISMADANRPINCIFSSGTVTRENTGDLISGNNFFDCNRIAVASNAVNINANSAIWTVSGNSFYQTATVTKTANGANFVAINLSNTGAGFIISNNFIGGKAANCGGGSWTTNGAFTQQFYGILVSAGDCSIQGNTISKLNYTSTNPFPFFGIRVNAGTYNIGASSGNTVGASNGTGSISITNSAANATSFGIIIAAAGNGIVNNNAIGSISTVGTAAFSHSFNGIRNTSSSIIVMGNNTIGSTVTPGSLSASTASTSATGQFVMGINSSGTGTIIATGNTIQNLSNNYTGTNAAGQVIGINSTGGSNFFSNNFISNLSTASSNAGTNASASVIGISNTSPLAGQTISKNSIRNNSNTSVAAVVHNYGVYYQSATTGTNVVSGNLIYGLSLSSSSTAANITGIRINGGVTTYSNNIISLGTGVTTGYVIHGIFENGTAGNNTNIYFNTIYIGGSPASGSNTAAFFSNANTNTRDFRDNIFDNSRSGGANHYAAFFNYATAGALTLNYNDYFAPGTGGKLGFFNGSNVTVLPLIAGNDANSLAINPVFSNPGGTNAIDYLPAATLNGVSIAAVTNDYFLASRPATPTMGALETACTPPLSAINSTLPSNLSICDSTSTILSASGTGILGWYDAAVGGTYLGSGNTYVTPILNATTTYYVQDSTCAPSATRTAITVTVNPAITSTSSQTNITCNGFADGTATVVVSGGSPGYSYAWSPSGGSGATASGLASGNYTCTVTDANICSIDVTFLITEPTALSSADSQTDLTCNGAGNGTATVVVSGGTPAYTYSWTPSGGTAATATSLAAGNYTCTITDANACTLDETFTLTEPVTLTAVKTKVDVTCFGGSDGSGTVIPSGGTAPYTYLWFPTGGTGATETGLTAGAYNCTITDANGCSIIKLFLINSPPPITSAPSQTDVTCNGANSGSATVVAGGGNAPYTYLWTPSGGTGSTESALIAGNYTCTITDASGCTFDQTFTITEPAAITDAPGQTDITCNGAGNGTATVSISGGTAPYTYAWLPSGGTSATASGLAAGTYTCNVTDANACSFSETFLITEPAALTATTSQIDNTCGGGSNGSATVVVSGGTPAYSYLWTPSGGTASTASLLIAGTYTCTISDANACSLQETFTITEPSSIGATTSQTDVSCGGGSNGSASVVASGGTPAYSYAWAPSGGNAATASSLTAGTYTCIITDANSCTLNVTFTITAPAALTAVSSQTDNSCNGGTAGNATVTALGGTPAYSYSWAPTGGTAATASSLAAGNYTCTVTDANSCSLAVTFTITEPPAITSVNSQTDITCFGANNGTATVSISGGTPGYSYAWLPSGGTAATANSLSAGTYTCVVTDANACTDNETFTIIEPPILSVTPSQLDVTCNGGSNGSASVAVSGGTPAYSYNWTPSGGTGSTASSLVAGTYTCTITDANSCITTQTFTIAEPTLLVASASAQTNISCFGGSNGSATVSVSGGTPGYTYLWNPSGGTAATASALTVGNYTCTITDANNCTTTQTFNITEPPALLILGGSQSDVTCNGGNNGTASVIASGGTGVLTYDWTPGNPVGDGTSSVSGLTAGSWTCTITDANGCTVSSTTTITEPSAISTSVSAITNVSCNGGNTGHIIINPATGGIPPYTYDWTPGNPSGDGTVDITGLTAGTWTCTITDANGCFITQTATVTEPSPLVASALSQTNISCNGGSNGAASVSVSGGTLPYTYNWTPGNPTGDGTGSVTGLTSGTWTCTVTDANNCTTTQTFDITEPSVLVASALSQTDISCNGGNNGSASVSVAGGTPAYSYNWTPSGGATSVASSLTAGNYTCTITDANSCVTTQTFLITEPAPLVASPLSQTNISCNGGSNGSATVAVAGGTPLYAYNWAPSGGTAATASPLAAGSYTCTVTDANSCITTQTFDITEPSALTATSSSTAATCGSNNGTATAAPSGGVPGYTYSWSPSGGTAAIASSLVAGNYTCTITDANSCTTSTSVTVTSAGGISASIISSTNISCNGGTDGTATAAPTGGTAPYTYSWSPSGGTGATEIGLGVGSYTCTITDFNGCFATASTTITQPTSISVSASQTDNTCNGANSGSATVVASGGTPAYTYNWAPSGGTAATASGLAAGNYTCTITDANSCSTTQTFTITEPVAISVTTSQTNNSCNGGATGTASVLVSGGTPGYTYNWSPSGGTAATASALSAGNYTCTITDANSCTATQTFNITEPSALSIAASQINVSCNGGASGSALVIVSGGTPTYTYNWAPSGGSASLATSLSAGNYTCTITDANSCTTTQTFLITEPLALSVTTSQINISCNGGSNGSATVAVAGGTPAYTYTWTPSGGTGATASGLTVGNYTCTIIDANSCTITQSFSITEPSPLSVTASQINSSCNGSATGSATVAVAGGTPAYTYSWTPSGGTGATASGLTAGNYTCTITDANSCTITQTFLITEPSAIVVAATQTNVSCFGGNNGDATVIVSGGTPGYSYNWTPTGGNAATASSLSAGAYTCTITDANSCITTQTFSITSPSVITSVNTQINVGCFGGNNGSATVTASGGTPGYTYNWTPSGGTGATASGLTAGNYTCTITDANACTSTQTFTITEPPVLSATTSQMNVTCFAGNNGIGTVIVSGGTLPYSFSWSPFGGTGMTASGLTAGTYTCTITDANSCSMTQTISIAEPTEITASVAQTDILCFGGTNGTADITASGGTPGYNYLWSPGGQTTSSLTGLSAGSYTCTITDGNGCTLDQGINITEPNILAATVSSVPVICQGASNGSAMVNVTGGTIDYSFTWSPTGGNDSIATGLPAGLYTCNITDVNGCGLTATVMVTEPSPISVIPSHTNIVCNGGNTGTASVTVSGGNTPYTYNWMPSGGTGSTATNLSAGTYTCQVTDAGGCTYSQPITIAQPSALTATTSQVNVSCFGGSNGSATLIVNGGAPFYSYNWLPVGGSGPIASGLTAGTYTCNVTDANSCTMSQSFTITEPPVLSATISSTNTNCGHNNGTATLVASGGTTPYAYAWSPSGGNGATATAIFAGTYTCTLSDAMGCSGSYTVDVIDTPAPSLSLVSQTDILCNGNNTGSATMLGSGGAGTLTYSWLPSGGTAPVASSLTAGSYTCTVTDSAGCTQTQSVIITEPGLLTASSSSTAISCNGGNSTVTVIASGGVAPYAGTGTFTQTAGTYTYPIFDANGCSTSTSITITEPALLIASSSATSILCNGGTSTVTVSAIGGTNPYTGTGTFIRLAGTYPFVVTDANGCSAITSITLTEPSLLTATSSATGILCNGGNSTVTVTASGGTSPYTGEGTFTELAGTYSYPVTDANGCSTSSSITITQPALLVSVVDSVYNPVTCGGSSGEIYISVSGGTAGYTYLWSNAATFEDLTGLISGSYNCTVTDMNGCTSMVSTTLIDPAPPVVSVTIDTTLCSQDLPYVLTEGNPAGGVWSGIGISGNTFDPATSGIGSFVLTYTYTAPTGCSASASDTMVVDACIGIDEISNSTAWSVYPNPTFGDVILSNPADQNGKVIVEVYTSEGKLLSSENFEGSNLIHLNFGTQAVGVYLVIITTDKGTSAVHVFKQ